LAFPVAKTVRDLVRGRLSDASLGFNAVHAARAVTYGVDAISIDFTDPSKNFLQANIDADDIMQSSIYDYPLMTLYTISTSDEVFEKAEFSGTCTVIIDVWLSWDEGNLLFDMESWAESVEDTMISIFNDRTNQDWGATVHWDSRIKASRTKIEQAGDNWRQLVSFTLVFEVTL